MKGRARGSYSTTTRAGWWFSFAVVATLAPAYGLSVTLMFLMGAMFIAILLYNLIAAALSLRSVTTKLIEVPRLRAGRSVTLSIEIANASGFFGVGHADIELVTENLKGEPAHLEWLAAGASGTVVLTLEPERRGRARINACRLMTTYPFGLMGRVLITRLDRELIVYPGLLDHLPGRLMARRMTSGVLPRSTDDYQYLTTYRAGEDVRRIHWRKSTLLDTPVLKRDLVSLETLVPRLFVPDSTPHFEYAVSALATLLTRETTIGGWAVMTEHGMVEAAEPEELMRLLALIEPLPEHLALRDYAAEGFRPIYASELGPEEKT